LLSPHPLGSQRRINSGYRKTSASRHFSYVVEGKTEAGDLAICRRSDIQAEQASLTTLVGVRFRRH
jgi:hypothetical protein